MGSRYQSRIIRRRILTVVLVLVLIYAVFFWWRNSSSTIESKPAPKVPAFNIENAGVLLTIFVDHNSEAQGINNGDLVMTLECLRQSAFSAKIDVIVFNRGGGTMNIRQQQWWEGLSESFTPEFRKFKVVRGSSVADLNSVIMNNVNSLHFGMLATGLCPSPSWTLAALTMFQPATMEEWNGTIGIVGSRVVHKGEIEHAGVDYRITRFPGETNEPMPFYLLRGLLEHDRRADVPRSVWSVGRTGMVVTFPLFVAAGGFDELMHPQFDALDLCLKVLRWNFTIMYCTDCLVHRRTEEPYMKDHYKARDPLSAAGEAFGRRWSSFLRRRMYDRYEVQNITLLWDSPVATVTGFATEAITFLQGLETRVFLKAIVDDGEHELVDMLGLPECYTEELVRLQDRVLVGEPSWPIISFHLWTAERFNPPPYVVYSIGRSMYESDGVPNHWYRFFKVVDELWVPSEFNVQTFRQNNVDNIIRTLPQAIDVDVFDPRTVEPLPVSLPADLANCYAPNSVYKFLSVFDWTDRKGWEQLLQAYGQEFAICEEPKNETSPPTSGEEKPPCPAPVVLHIKTWFPLKKFIVAYMKTQEKQELWISDYMARHLKRGCIPPSVRLVENKYSMREVPRIYRSMDAFVLPSHGEGWGRPYVEAMAMDMPVIGTNWSAMTEFFRDDVSFPISYKLNRVGESYRGFGGYTGHNLAIPNITHLREHMRHLVENPETGRLVGRRARKMVVERYSVQAVGDLFIMRLREVVDNLPELISQRRPKLNSNIPAYFESYAWKGEL